MLAFSFHCPILPLSFVGPLCWFLPALILSAFVYVSLIVCFQTQYNNSELCDRGSLHDLLRSDEKMPTKLQFKLMHDIAKGMLHLSMEGIVHKDLAARNVLVSEKKNRDVINTLPFTWFFRFFFCFGYFCCFFCFRSRNKGSLLPKCQVRYWLFVRSFSKL